MIYNPFLISIILSHLLLQTSNIVEEPSQPESFRNYVCYYTADPIEIDGELNEVSWSLADNSEAFVDIEGPSKPLHDTRVKMLWDDEYLYIGAKLIEPHIWATYTQRESVIFHENDFEIFIDPNGDTHNYYEIEVNALNTIWDLLLTKPYRDGGKPISSWNVVGMKSAVFLKGTINDPSDIDEYWSVEFALPWSSLKEHAKEQRKPKDGEQWRINFSRVQWQLDIINDSYQKRINPETHKSFPEYNWVWSPQGIINMHQPETWGFLQFTKNKVGGQNDQFIFNREELCKWDLRKVYYAQQKYKRAKSSYGSMADLAERGLYSGKPENILSDAFDQDSYVLKHFCKECSCNWFIRQDGLVWQEK